MNITEINNTKVGKDILELIKELFPICRSITGNGVRETLSIIKEIIPELKIFEVKSNTKVFDWDVPKEWNINDAYIKNSKNEKIIDFKKSNLHVLNYSIPINCKLSLAELKKHIFTNKDQPNLIPYRTSYYKENWGFCMSEKQFKSLEEDTYEIVIDSSLENGSLTYGELFLKGQNPEEILLTCYVCHPSMCNDNLSGTCLLTHLSNAMSKMKLKYSYRFLFIPETIGAIVWLSKNQNSLSNIKFGIVATCVGDRGKITFKKTKNGNSLIDKITEETLTNSKKPYKIVDFFPWGSDERQFSSPGINIPMASIMRTMYSQFPEYHTSGDNLDFMSSESLEDSFGLYLEIIKQIESHESLENYEKEKTTIDKIDDEIYKNLNPFCEPQLGKRGLYEMTGGMQQNSITKNAIFWILNFSDGNYSLRKISELAGINYIEIKKSAELLVKENLLKRIN
jgi:aminopeptidase-like protein